MSGILGAFTGKSEAKELKASQELALRSQLEFARHMQIRDINYHINDLIQALKISTLEDVIKTLQTSQHIIQQVAESLIKCLRGDCTGLLEIAKNAQDGEAIVRLLYHKPLHILVALHKYHHIDVRSGIIGLLELPYIDYEFEFNGITPISDIYTFGPQLVDRMRQRLLIDISAALECGNFGKAFRLLDYDPEYLANAPVPNAAGKTIIFYALSGMHLFTPSFWGNKLLFLCWYRSIVVTQM